MWQMQPSRVTWTEHALVKASMLGFARVDVERALLEHHDRRQRNVGAAQWRVVVERFVVLYDHPDYDDALTARVVTLWRRR